MARKTQPNPKPTKPPKQPKNVRAPKPKHRWVENGSVGEWVSLPFQAETTVVTATERAQGKTKHERPKQLESQEPKNERTRPV